MMRATILVLFSFLVLSFASYTVVTQAGSSMTLILASIRIPLSFYLIILKYVYFLAYHLSKWTLTSQPPNAQEEVILGFALKQQNLDKLASLFWSVSDPSSNFYGTI